jgi:SAM-dependent methyltransferase
LKHILNLGSGEKKREDAVNVDLVQSTGPDIVHNLNIVPWPLPGDHFSCVYANDVLEHLDDLIAAMEEIHRVCQNGAVVHITLPHFSSANAFRDPTHKRFTSYFSFHYFTGQNQWAFYTDKRFRRRQSQIFFYPTITNKLVHRLANWRPEEYEQRWCWIFPAWFLSFELEVVK